MSTPLYIRNCLTEKEFDHLWKLKDDASEVTRTSLHQAAAMADGTASDISYAVNRQKRLSIESNAAFEIIQHIFTGPKGDFNRASLLPSQESFRTIANAFNGVAPLQSGLLIPIAKLITGVAFNPNNVDPEALTHWVVPHVFMDPHKVAELNGNTDGVSEAHQKNVTGTFSKLVAHLFGVDYRHPTDCVRVYNPLPRHLTPKVLESVLGIFGNLGTPDHHRTLMHHFWVNAQSQYPDLFQDPNLKAALTQKSTALRLNSEKAANLAGQVNLLKY